MTMPVFVDSHVNLHSEKYEEGELETLIENAQQAGVAYMLTISDQLSSTQAISDIAKRYPFMWRSVGVHPHHAKDYNDLDTRTLLDLAEAEKVVGIGECGLDFHYEYSDREIQEQVFAKHIEASQKTRLPLIIHTREADDLMRKMLDEAYQREAFVPLLHCYTSGLELAKEALDMGGYVAFSGIITFKKAQDVCAIAQETPIERIIIETDCPYLAPVPMRGRRNEPAYLVHVAQKLAEIKGISTEEVARITTENFFRLFPQAIRNDEILAR